LCSVQEKISRSILPDYKDLQQIFTLLVRPRVFASLEEDTSNSLPPFALIDGLLKLEEKRW